LYLHVGLWIQLEPALKFTKRARALRKPFVATIVVTDVVSERQVSARTSDLSVHGCFVPTSTPLNPGAKVQITIVHAGAKVSAFGRVASSRVDGMGIGFIKIEQRDQTILERWISDMRKK
jgi:hypothetical protein